MDEEKRIELRRDILGGKAISGEDAGELLAVVGPDVSELATLANWVRHERKTDRIAFCAIINARSGRCSEDCSFCAQSVHHDTCAPVYDMVSVDKILDAARRARNAGAVRFSIVTSGLALEDTDVDEVCRAVEGMAGLGLSPCASLGVLDRNSLDRLHDSGLKRYHHNLETARSYFPNVCTTHSYDDDIETIHLARSVGLETCCGGIFGLGESPGQRVELLETIAGLDPDGVPMNFLVPIPGTPLENMRALSPVDCLKIIAVARLMLPRADIILCGGREANLRDMQGAALLAGSSGLMIGDYLTTPGRKPEQDRDLVIDAGLSILETPP